MTDTLHEAAQKRLGEIACALSQRPTLPAFMDKSETADYLLISKTTLWRRSNDGQIPGQRTIGGVTRWSRHVIDLWILAGCPDAADFEAGLSKRFHSGSTGNAAENFDHECDNTGDTDCA